jgi:hypothetical protein
MTILTSLCDSRAGLIFEEKLRTRIAHDASDQRSARHRIHVGAQSLRSAGVSPAFFAMRGDQKYYRRDAALRQNLLSRLPGTNILNSL